jgi:hypothetical protein
MEEQSAVKKKYAEGCLRLFAAIIGKAVQDACLHPIKDRVTKQLRVSPVARDAIEFIFLPNDAFHTYMSFLDMDVNGFRKNLVECMSSNSMKNAFIDRNASLDKRSFRHNYRWVIAENEKINKFNNYDFGKLHV